MVRILKYPIPDDENDVPMPAGAEILCVQVQNEQPFLWAKVDDEMKPQYRSILVVNTGERMFPGRKHKYIGTFQLNEGKYVGHVFEVV